MRFLHRRCELLPWRANEYWHDAPASELYVLCDTQRFQRTVNRYVFYGISFTRALSVSLVVTKTVLLLILSNVFMTFAWYAHLKELNAKPWIIAVLVSWCVAFFEYLIQVPANRLGYTVLNLGQLKILQEVITLTVFMPFAFYYMRQPLKWDYLWAACCLAGAVYFVFRK